MAEDLPYIRMTFDWDNGTWKAEAVNASDAPEPIYTSARQYGLALREARDHFGIIRHERVMPPDPNPPAPEPEGVDTEA